MNAHVHKIALELRQLRKDLSLSQRGLAKLFNKTEPLELQTSREDISKYENCGAVIPADKYKKFIDLLK
jgi:transcriptional regulator with XRE-family HTH domain